MENKLKNISSEIFNLYDNYAHNKMEHRQFGEKLSTYAVGGVTVTSLLKHLMPDYDSCKIVAPG